MANELIINVTEYETRVALLEDRVLAELYIERAKDRGIMGNIYKGKVVKVLPGMQAAFVDIGLEKAAFLYVADVHGSIEDYEDMGFQGEEMPAYLSSPSSRSGPPLRRPGDIGSGFQRASRHEGDADHLPHHIARQVSCLHAAGGPCRGFEKD